MTNAAEKHSYHFRQMVLREEEKAKVPFEFSLISSCFSSLYDLYVSA